MKCIVERDNHHKTISINITGDTVHVYAPTKATQAEIIEQINKIRPLLEISAARSSPYTKAELKEMKTKAAEIFPPRVEYYAKLIGVTYSEIKYNRRNTYWGECCDDGTLTFNYLAVNAPPESIDALIVHELCHRIEMNHKKPFWDLVHHYCPTYNKDISWFDNQGNICGIRAAKPIDAKDDANKN